MQGRLHQRVQWNQRFFSRVARTVPALFLEHAVDSQSENFFLSHHARTHTQKPNFLTGVMCSLFFLSENIQAFLLSRTVDGKRVATFLPRRVSQHTQHPGKEKIGSSATNYYLRLQCPRHDYLD